MHVECAHQPCQRWDIQQRIIYPMEPSCQLYAEKLRAGILNSSGGFEVYFFLVSCCMWCIFWGLLLCLKANFSTHLCWLTEAFEACFWTFTLLCHFLLAEHSTYLAQHHTVLWFWLLNLQKTIQSQDYVLLYCVWPKRKKNCHHKAWFSLSSFRNEVWSMKVLFYKEHVHDRVHCAFLN